MPPCPCPPAPPAVSGGVLKQNADGFYSILEPGAVAPALSARQVMAFAVDLLLAAKKVGLGLVLMDNVIAAKELGLI